MNQSQLNVVTSRMRAWLKERPYLLEVDLVALVEYMIGDDPASDAAWLYTAEELFTVAAGLLIFPDMRPAKEF